MKFEGQLSRDHFGGEVWILRTGEGAQYQLKGRIPRDLEGSHVQVDAEPAKESYGFSMVGEILEVSSIRRLS